MEHHRTHNAIQRSVGEWIHAHAHEHGQENDLINRQGESHREYHRQHPGYSHEHPHYRFTGHTYDHHDPAEERRPTTADDVLDALDRDGYAIVDRSDPDGSPDPLPC